MLNIRIAGDAAADFLSAINKNLTPKEPKSFERRVIAEGLPPTDKDDFIRYVETSADAFVEQINAWVLERKKTALAKKGATESTEPLARVGMGIYLFQSCQED